MRRWILPIVIACVHLALLAIPARQKIIGTYQTETDFYQYYAPDSERIAARQFPECPYQGPGYATLVALVSTVTGDPLTSGTWISVTSAVLVGLLCFLLLGRLFGYWVGIAAQALVPAMSVMPVLSISAMTDLPFLALCLATLLVVTGGRRASFARAAAAGALSAAAYLVRYNGIFLIAACAIGIGVLNLYDRPLSQRIRLTAVTVAIFVLTASPWFYANYRHRGSPVYNLNYLNVAIEFYGGELSQDGTRAMASRFHSLREVALTDPVRVVTHYPANVAASLKRSVTDLATWWVAVPAVLGLVIVLARRPSKPVLLLLVSEALYVLLMGWSHWETRYYVLLLVLYVGLACHGMAVSVRVARTRGWLSGALAAGVAAALVAIFWASRAAPARTSVADLLRDQPLELLEARQFLDDTGGKAARVLARKPHLAYISRREWVYLPQVSSVDELRVWLDAHPVDYVLIGPVEAMWRPALSLLRDPRSAPAWLRPLWVSRNAAYVLYAPAGARRAGVIDSPGARGRRLTRRTEGSSSGTLVSPTRADEPAFR